MKPDPTITRIVIGDKFSEEGVELVQASKNLTGKPFPMNAVSNQLVFTVSSFSGSSQYDVSDVSANSSEQSDEESSDEES